MIPEPHRMKGWRDAAWRHRGRVAPFGARGQEEEPDCERHDRIGLPPGCEADQPAATDPYCSDVTQAIPTTAPSNAAHAAMRTMVRTEHTIFMLVSLSMAGSEEAGPG